MENPVVAKSHALKDVSDRFACNHVTCELRLRTVARGLTQRVMQCLRCGSATSKAYSKHDAYAITGGLEPPPFDDDLLNGWQERKQKAYDEVNERFSFLSTRSEPSRPKTAEWFKQYNKYLASDHWAATREKVLKRANGICEGCLERKAVHVHHLKYEHLGNEFMFELVALCEECHERAHGGA